MHRRDSSRREATVAMLVACALLAGSLLRIGVAVAGSSHADPVRGPVDAPTPFTPLLFGPGLDPSEASAAVWQAVPGIGPGRAQAIVEARVRSPFCEPEDLLRVSGVGPKTLARIRPWIAPPPWLRRCVLGREGTGP